MTAADADPPAVAVRRGEGTALWRQIARALEAEIENGPLAGGEPLPPEGALARRFAVNRHTVRRALAALAERGLIRTEQGRGSFVQDVVVDYPLRRRTSFSANLLEQDRVPSHHVLDVAAAQAVAPVAGALEIAVGAPVARVRAIGLADRVPITFSLSWLPLDRLPGALEAAVAATSMSQVYAACGVATYRRRSTRITARLPSPEEAKHLRQAPNLPVLVTDAVDVGPDGRPIRFGTTCFAAARVQLTVEPGS